MGKSFRRALVPIGAVLVLSLTVSPGGAGAAAPLARVPFGTIVTSRFVKSFELDNGSFDVKPATGISPERSRQSVVTEMSATDQVGGDYLVAVGFGSVTISKAFPGVPKVKNLRAWVGLMHTGSGTCSSGSLGPTQTKKVRHPSNGWAAVVVGNAPNSPDVVYRAASFLCGNFPASVENASEVLSVPWHAVGDRVFARIPFCGQFTGDSESGPSGTATLTLSIDVTVPEDMAIMPKAPDLAHCLPARTVFVPVEATSFAHHAPLGPEGEIL